MSRNSTSNMTELSQLGVPVVQPFQLGYVTTDLEAAIDNYRRILGGTQFAVSDSSFDARVRGQLRSMRTRLAFGFIGATMVELIEPVVDEAGFYTDVLPSTGYGIALHHLGYVLDSDVDWHVLKEKVGQQRISFEITSDPNVIFVDTQAELGHQIELLQFSAATMESFVSHVPRNGETARAVS